MNMSISSEDKKRALQVCSRAGQKLSADIGGGGGVWCGRDRRNGTGHTGKRRCRGSACVDRRISGAAAVGSGVFEGESSRENAAGADDQDVASSVSIF